MGVGSDESTTMPSEEDIDVEDYSEEEDYIEDSTQETDEPGRWLIDNTKNNFSVHSQKDI